MEKKSLFPYSLTRENHLNHMTRVVPFIVFLYILQSYLILGFMHHSSSKNSVMAMGICLACMVGLLLCYDLCQKSTLHEEFLETSFLNQSEKIYYADILRIEITQADQSFSNLKIMLNNKVAIIYFVDDCEKVKSIIESRKNKNSEQMAA